jgi:hypothetical protein
MGTTKPELQELEDGTKVWYFLETLHREDGPAVEFPDGCKVWYSYGVRHREDGPAVEYVNGSKMWYFKGVRHREDGPAIEYASGGKMWYSMAKLHRTDGPAIEYANGNKEWWVDGVQVNIPPTAPTDTVYDAVHKQARWAGFVALVCLLGLWLLIHYNVSSPDHNLLLYILTHMLGSAGLSIMLCDSLVTLFYYARELEKLK